MPTVPGVAFPAVVGLNLVDGGRQAITDAEGKRLEAYVSHFVCERCLQDLGFNAVDVELAELNGNPPRFRYVEDEAFAKRAVKEHKCPAAAK